MRCEQFEERLQGLLDRRAIPSHDRALLAHASVCSHCRKVLRWEEEVAEYLGDDGESASVDFSELVTARLVRGVAADRADFSRRLKWGARCAPWLAIAGAAVLLISVGVFRQPAPRGTGNPRSMTQRTAAEVDQSTEALVAGEEPQGSLPPGATRELVSMARGRREGADEVAATVAGDLSPWARSIGGAFATLTGRRSSTGSAPRRPEHPESP